MKAERFEIIYNNLTKRVEETASRYDKLLKKSDIKNFTVSQLEDIIKFSHEEISRMDRILHAELYHILGADLSPVQQSKFISLLKKYLSYRSDLKRIFGWCSSTTSINLETFPNIPVKSDYKLNILGDFKIEYNLRDGVEIEDTYTLEESSTLSEINNNEENLVVDQDLPFYFNAKGKLVVDRIQKKEFKKWMDSCGFGVSKLLNSMNNNKTYDGIQWLHTADGLFVGEFINDDIRLRFEKAMKE